jgi:hypothetical protein
VNVQRPAGQFVAKCQRAGGASKSAGVRKRHSFKVIYSSYFFSAHLLVCKCPWKVVGQVSSRTPPPPAYPSQKLSPWQQTRCDPLRRWMLSLLRPLWSAGPVVVKMKDCNLHHNCGLTF